MQLIEFHALAGLAMVVLLFVRHSGWRWGLVALCGWMTSGFLVVTALAFGLSNGTGQVFAAVGAVFYISIIGLFINHQGMFRWPAGFFGLPAVFLVLGGPA